MSILNTLSNYRRIIEAGLGLVALALIVAWLSGAFEDRIASQRLDLAKQQLAAGEELYETSLTPSQLTEWNPGAIASARQTTVAARVLARITDIHVVAGDSVTAGQELVRLDDRDFVARVAQTTEALNAAKSQQDLAAREKARVEELVTTGASTVQRLDQVSNVLRVANAEVLRLEQVLDEARTALSHTRILSPVSGRIVDRNAEPGETAAPGRALLYIYDPSVLRVEVPVRENLAVQLKLGQALGVRIESLDLDLEGIVDEIVPFAEPGSRTLLVKIRLPQMQTWGDRDILAGMFARVGIPAGQGHSLLVPVAAVTRIGQLEYVTVWANGTRERRLITTGNAIAGMLDVLSGLRPGDLVIVPE